MKQPPLKALPEHVTPLKAQVWLNRNKNNRNMREGVAEKYAADMKAGKWTKCPAPIVFYENGDLADGQHRLWAVVDSDKGQDFLVVRDFPQDAAINIDTGAGRSLMDNAKLSGLDNDLSHKLIATARAIEEGTGTSKGTLSYAKRLEFIEKHREAARWAIANAPQGRNIGTSLMFAAVARAYYHEDDKERLEYFGRVVSRGYSAGSEDNAGIGIRNYLQGLGPRTSAANWRDTFFKIQNAIWYFMRRRSLTVIKHVADERYPKLKK